MKVEIDTTAKTIVLKSQIKFSELEELKRLIGADYDQYTVTSEVIYTQPIFNPQPATFPNTPFYGEHPITCDCSDETFVGVVDAFTYTVSNPFTITASMN